MFIDRPFGLPAESKNRSLKLLAAFWSITHTLAAQIHPPMHPSIPKIQAKIEAMFTGEGTGHDWFHIERVTKLAGHIASKEGAQQEITMLGALLHDVADWKFHGGNLNAGPEKALEVMKEFDVPEEWHAPVVEIVARVSYKGAGVPDNMPLLEGKCVQDADRIDAIGAVGVARTFAYGGSTGQAIYDPALDPELHTSFDDYANKRTSTINHFHEKLLLLKGRLHTKEGKRIAEERHLFMETFLAQFHKEWQCQIPV